MIDDEDELAAYDLDAWQAPRAPAGLADAVIRRMKEPPGIESGLPPAPAVEARPPARRRRRRWWSAAAVLVAAAVLLIILIGVRREPADGPATPPAPAVDPPPRPACDPDGPADEATTAMSNGDYAGALAGFERSLACRHDPALISSAFIAACGVKDLARAKVYWKQLPARRQTLLQRCLSNDIDPR